LKLLVKEEPIDDAIDDEWEADITFSYKPIKGKCKRAGDFKYTQKSGPYEKDGYMTSEACKASNGLSAAGYSEATIKKMVPTS
jgi:hypothetical protein